MSHVLWCNLLTTGSGAEKSVHRSGRRLLKVAEDALQIPEEISPGNLNHAGRMLFHLCSEAKRQLVSRPELGTHGPVGLYCALSGGSCDASVLRQLMDAGEGSPVERHRKAFSPRSYVHSNPALLTGQLAIYLGTTGRALTLSHPTRGLQHGLDLAREDLISGRVSAAVVGAAFSLENPESVQKYDAMAPEHLAFSETGFAAILLPASNCTDTCDCSFLHIFKNQIYDEDVFRGVCEILFAPLSAG